MATRPGSQDTAVRQITDAGARHMAIGTASNVTEDSLNLKQVARLLGVHYMTAYRYVRHGRLPAHQVGSSWFVDRRDVEEFRSEPAPTTEPVDWSSRLVAPLAAGDEVAAWAVVRDARNGGIGFDEVHLDVVARAVGSVPGGDTAMEHRLAVTTAGRLVARLGGEIPHRGRKLGTVVLASPPGEHHGLALSIVSNIVRHGGFRVLELGTDSAPRDVVAAVESVDDPVAVCVSVTTSDCWRSAAELVAAVRAVLADVPILLGGQAVASPEVAAVTGATGWSAGPDLVVTLKELARRRKVERPRS
ncbi:MAG: helix-turn-helix domain-containing protein [Acidimicrobiales bacterium]|nr:helix-turn-helix domain-containing protein [Acidimicrobiales bacterium]